MTQITQEVRDFLATGPLGHVVTLNQDGTPHLTLAWVGVDGEELVWSTFFDQHKLRSLGTTPGSRSPSRPKSTPAKAYIHTW